MSSVPRGVPDTWWGQHWLLCDLWQVLLPFRTSHSSLTLMVKHLDEMAVRVACLL